MATWAVGTYALNGALIANNLGFSEANFSWLLNQPGAFEATIPLTDATATPTNWAPGQREIRVTRDGVLVWGGYLWRAQVDPRGYSLQVAGEGYLSKLRYRFTVGELIYNDVAQQTIAWGLINETQGQPGGSLGLSQGSHTGASVVRDRDYCAGTYPNVFSSIQELSEMDDGLDIRATPTPMVSTNKAFQTASPLFKTDRSGSVSVGQLNTWSLDYDLDATQVVSRAITIGNGDCNPPEDDRTDATSLSTYGLMMNVESLDSSHLSDVRAHGRETIRNFKTHRFTGRAQWSESQPVAGPTFGTFDVGDLITASTTRGYASYSQAMRVISFETSLSDRSLARFTATLDSVTA